METTLSIRQATANDLPKLKEIIDLSFPRFFRYFALHSVADLSEPVFIGETGGIIAGFAKLIEFEIGGVWYGCILWIAVHPAHRRRGIALNLTHAGVCYLKSHGAQAVFASTQKRNIASQTTLGKAGFERTGFSGLWRMFGWRVFTFNNAIWLAPGEIVLIHV